MIEVEPIRKQDKTYQLDNLNKDLNLLKTITHNVLEEQASNDKGPRSMKQLAQILKNRNAKFNYNDVKKQRSKHWLKKNGINFENLSNKVQDQKRKYEELAFSSRGRQFQDHIKDKRIIESKIISQVKQVVHPTQLHFDNFTLNNQEQYLQLQQDLIAKQLVCESMKLLSRKANHAEGLLQQRLINKINGRQYDQQLEYEEFQDGYDSQYQPKHRSQKLNIRPDTLKDNRQVRLKYMKAVDLIVKSKNYDRLTEQFWKTSIETFYQQFWAIKYFQEKEVQANLQFKQQVNEQEAITILMIKSLTMVEEEFEKQLNTNLEILEKRFSEGELQRQLSFELPYLYYKSGDKKKFYQNLSSRNLLKLVNMFHKYDRSVAEGRPQPQYNGDILIQNSSFYSKNESRSKTKQISDMMNKDIHYQQLIYILQGQPIFSHQLICDPLTYDAAWIILRNSGIHLNDEDVDKYNLKHQQYLQIIQKLSKLYEANMKDITEISLKNMLYVCAYKQIVEILHKLARSSHNYVKISDKFDTKKQISNEFVLHFMLALYYNRHPFLKTSGYEDFVQNTLPQKLSQSLVSFICDMIKRRNQNNKNRQGSQQFIQQQKYIQDYILMLPIQKLSQSLQKIVSNIDIFKSLNWNQIFQYYAQLELDESISDAIESVLSNLLKTQVLSEQQQIYLVQNMKSYEKQVQCYLYIFMQKILKKTKIQEKQNIKEQKIKYSLFDMFFSIRSKGQSSKAQQDLTLYEKDIGEVYENQLQDFIQETINQMSVTAIDYEKIYEFFKHVCQLKRIVSKYIGKQGIGKQTLKDIQELILFIENSGIQAYLPSYQVDSTLQTLLINIKHLVKQYWNIRMEKIKQKPQNQDSHIRNEKISQLSNHSKVKIYYRYLQLLYISYDIIHHAKGNPIAIDRKHRQILRISALINNWEKEQYDNDL